MSDLNSVNVIGRLTKDVELNYSPDGTKAIGTITIANNPPCKKDVENKPVNYFTINCFGATAESCATNLVKGDKIGVYEGRLKEDTWNDKETGKKRSRIKIIAKLVDFIDTKKGRELRSQRQNQQ